MQKLLVSALALCAMSSVAFAEPAKLSDNQMGQIAAGQISVSVSTGSNSSSITQSSTATSTAYCSYCTGTASATNSGSYGTAAAAGIEVSSSATSFNIAHVSQNSGLIVSVHHH